MSPICAVHVVTEAANCQTKPSLEALPLISLPSVVTFDDGCWGNVKKRTLGK